MSGTTSTKRIKSPEKKKKPNDTAPKQAPKATAPAAAPKATASKALNIPLSDVSPEFKRLVVGQIRQSKNNQR